MARATIDAGVIATPVPINAGESVHIIYSGLLAKSGANKVYLHTGYGPSSSWQMIEDFEMSPSKWGWEAVVDITGDDWFNLCFHDCANNWDNNNGQNWSYEVHNGFRGEK